MSFVETIYHHKWAFTKILVITIVFLYIILRLIAVYGHQYIQNNWKYFRTKPYLAPLAGFFKKYNKEGTIKTGVTNVISILWTYVKMFFNELIKPFKYIIDIVYSIINAIKNTLDKFRQQLGVIRKLLLSIVEKVMERLQNLAATFINLFMKLRDIMKRSFATYQMMIYTVETMALTLKSMMTGPVGDLAHMGADLGYVFTFFLLGPLSFAMFPSLWYCVFCFHPETKLKLRDFRHQEISKIELGTPLIRGYVTGKMVFYLADAPRLYQNGRDLVTGDHYKLEYEWLPVKESQTSKLTTITSPLVYCVSTSNHCIITESDHYLDYDETSNLDIILRNKNKLLEMLNGNTQVVYDPDHLYVEGFLNRDLSFGNITDKELPYRCRDTRNKIVGIGIWLAESEVKWYQHNITKTIVTGSLIIYEDHQWIPAYQSFNFTEITDTTDPCFHNVSHWVTETGTIHLEELMTRDMLEIHDPVYHHNFTLESIS